MGVERTRWAGGDGVLGIVEVEAKREGLTLVDGVVNGGYAAVMAQKGQGDWLRVITGD